MKCECLVCGAKITGSKDELVAAGWSGTSFNLKTNLFSGSVGVVWCSGCFTPKAVSDITEKVQHIDDYLKNRAGLNNETTKQVERK